MDRDVLIVGAGPSGTAAAWQLRRAGFSVLMLDRKTAPAKPCAGGLTIKTLDLMPYSIAATIERVTNGVTIGVRSSGNDHLCHFAHRDPICAFAVRAVFDRFNVERALAAGADLETVSAIEAIEQDEHGVTLVADGRPIAAQYLIGADGANSTVRRLLFAREAMERGFALEGIVPYAAIGAEPRMELVFNVVADGYGWLFPKGDHINVGIYSSVAPKALLSKTQLRDYARRRLGTAQVEDIKGFPLGFGGARRHPAFRRVLLVGDAGGFAEPLLGEGIYNAVKTGQAAAAAIVDAERAGAALSAAYSARLRPVKKDLARCDFLARRVFYPHAARLGRSLMRFPWFRSAMLKGFAAGMTTREITGRFWLSPLFVPSHPLSLSESRLS